MKHFTNQAFTLIEVILAIVMSTVVLLILVPLMVSTLDTIGDSKKQRVFLSEYNAAYLRLESETDLYSNGLLLSNTGSDTYIFLNQENTRGVIVGMVGLDELRIEMTPDIYSHRVLGYKNIQDQELSDILDGTTQVQDIVFYRDSLFEGIPLKTNTITLYNSGSIVDFTFEIDVNYDDVYNGQAWSNIPKDTIISLNMSL